MGEHVSSDDSSIGDVGSSAVPSAVPAAFEELWRAGWSQDKLAEHFGTTRHYVRGWMKALGLPGAPSGLARPKRPASGWPPSRAELARLVRTHTMAEIGRMFGVRDRAVRYRVDQYKIPHDRQGRREPGDGRGLLERIQPPPRKELKRLYQLERHAADDLAQQYGVSATTVRKWLRDYNIPRLPDNMVRSGHATRYRQERLTAHPAQQADAATADRPRPPRRS